MKIYIPEVSCLQDPGVFALLTMPHLPHYDLNAWMRTGRYVLLTAGGITSERVDGLLCWWWISCLPLLNEIDWVRNRTYPYGVYGQYPHTRTCLSILSVWTLPNPHIYIYTVASIGSRVYLYALASGGWQTITSLPRIQYWLEIDQRFSASSTCSWPPQPQGIGIVHSPPSASYHIVSNAEVEELATIVSSYLLVSGLRQTCKS